MSRTLKQLYEFLRTVSGHLRKIKTVFYPIHYIYAAKKQCQTML